MDCPVWEKLKKEKLRWSRGVTVLKNNLHILSIPFLASWGIDWIKIK